MKVNYLGNAGQARMIRNGWFLKIAETCRETPEEMYARLAANYKQVKIYWTGTAIRGIHSYFAMVKR